MTATPTNLRPELWRKSIHMTSGLVPLAYGLWGHRQTVLIILGVSTLVMMTVELIRRGDHWFARSFRRLFHFMLRDHEHRGLLGATPYCFGAWVSVMFFAKPVAVLALLYLAVGDTAASLIGMQWGRHRIGRKSLEGFLGFWLATSLVALAAHACSPSYPLPAALIASPIAGLVELSSLRVDDNLSIPLTTGAMISLLLSIGL